MLQGETILSGAPTDERVSEFKVMKSAAGYYIGTSYTEPEGYDVPNSRESEYFVTEELAKATLKEWNHVASHYPDGGLIYAYRLGLLIGART
jgi:hypothetical protein